MHLSGEESCIVALLCNEVMTHAVLKFASMVLSMRNSCPDKAPPNPTKSFASRLVF